MFSDKLFVAGSLVPPAFLVDTHLYWYCSLALLLGILELTIFSPGRKRWESTSPTELLAGKSGWSAVTRQREIVKVEVQKDSRVLPLCLVLRFRIVGDNSSGQWISWSVTKHREERLRRLRARVLWSELPECKQ